jgi:hypothetical protein
MKIIYIASPYTIGDVAANVHVQIEAAHKIMDAGHCSRPKIWPIFRQTRLLLRNPRKDVP